MYEILFSAKADLQMEELEKNVSKKGILKQVRKILGLMEKNLRHPSLNTHKFSAIQSPFGGEVFESYAQNRTPAAYRVFWVYGPNNRQITILAITSHP